MLHCITNLPLKHTTVNCVGLLVGDLDAELLLNCQCLHSPLPGYGYANLLNCHHDLYGVQAVKTEVVGEVRAGGELRERLATFRQRAVNGFVLSKGRRPGETMSV